MTSCRHGGDRKQGCEKCQSNETHGISLAYRTWRRHECPRHKATIGERLEPGFASPKDRAGFATTTARWPASRYVQCSARDRRAPQIARQSRDRAELRVPLPAAT